MCFWRGQRNNWPSGRGGARLFTADGGLRGCQAAVQGVFAGSDGKAIHQFSASRMPLERVHVEARFFKKGGAP